MVGSTFVFWKMTERIRGCLNEAIGVQGERESKYLTIVNEIIAFDFEIVSCSLVMCSVGRD